MAVSENPGAMPATQIVMPREFLDPGHHHGSNASLGSVGVITTLIADTAQSFADRRCALAALRSLRSRSGVGQATQHRPNTEVERAILL